MRISSHHLSTVVLCVCTLMSQNLVSVAQSVYAPMNQDYYHIIDRMDVLNVSKSHSIHTSFKPYLRKDITQLVENTDSTAALSRIDSANVLYILDDNSEWANNHYSQSKKPILKWIYRNKADYYHVKEESFDFHINPVLGLGLGKENNGWGNTYYNTRGVEMRGMIDKKVGFYAYMTENQMITPSYVYNYIYDKSAVPGENYWKPFKKNGVDFFTARAYITFSATKHIQFQLGHDKNMVGNGYRSLILSDFSGNYPFLKIQTKIWRFQYTNLFAQLNAGVFTDGTGNLLGASAFPKKFLAFHHLNYQITKNLHVGIFESVMYFRGDSLGNMAKIDLNYLNPVIFYRSVEQNTGSGGNAMLGIDYKWNFLKHFSLYGQAILDEFVASHVIDRDGWVNNKYAIQCGLKYYNAFGIKNLDLQGEYNVVRPYTYSHFVRQNAHAHFEMPLAHPLGANFNEFVGILRYQPAPKWFVTGKLFLIEQGLDGLNTHVGTNILVPYTQADFLFGNKVGQGISSTTTMLDGTITYRIKHNLFVDLKGVVRDQKIANTTTKTLWVSAALRWNLAQRSNEF